MKKIYFLIISIIIIIVILLINTNEEYIIPQEAIRLRIIANSNSFNDQYIKLKVKDKVEDYLESKLKDSTEINNTREIITKNLHIIEKIVKQELITLDSNLTYDINYGANHFPLKKYKDVIYASGNYESLVIKLGNGDGDNWWCIIFPPVCFMEYNGEEIEYKVYVKEIFERYFK